MLGLLEGSFLGSFRQVAQESGSHADYFGHVWISVFGRANCSSAFLAFVTLVSWR
jgi:hypothetical protein